MKLTPPAYQFSKQQGFTLLELMVVIMLVGVMATMVQFNVSGKRPEDVLQQESTRFAAIFDVASEYGMLNNIELGLMVKKDSYQFLAYDGTRWAEISDQDWNSNITLPEQVDLTIELDDLPIEEPMLFDVDTFRQKDEDDFTLLSKEEQEKKIIPQVYILSGGDITPFSVTFRLNEDFIYSEAEEELAFRVTGIYTTPLTIEGPILDDL
ncbi:type II secretion system minor pseudopilin GspH [Colwelliaceae bacterium MEBiC 14330]